MRCSESKMKATSVWAEGLQKTLVRMKSQDLVNCIGDFQRKLQLHEVLWEQNEGNIRLSWRSAEDSHTHEITILVQLHRWFSKEVTASWGALRAKWRQHPFELKVCWSLSYAWSHHICSAAQLHRWFSKEVTTSWGALRPKRRQHPFEMKSYRNLSRAWNNHFGLFNLFSKKLTQGKGDLDAPWKRTLSIHSGKIFNSSRKVFISLSNNKKWKNKYVTRAVEDFVSNYNTFPICLLLLLF